jgi:tetratricopeptide (TPR) repeat protein
VKHPLVRLARALAIFLLLSAAMPTTFADGWGFVPTALDWQTWPMYCRVQYSYINHTANDYGRYYSDSEIASWRSVIGEKTFIALHHYCAAMIFIRQWKAETNPQNKKYLLGRALDDGEFSYVRTDSSSIVYPSVASVLAQAKFANGNTQEAIDMLRRAIDAQPKSFPAYATLSQHYRSEHDLPMALKVLGEADAATQGQDAEVQYNLGLLNLESGNTDAAVENARRAYALGYPLPGLKTKLAKLGHWPPKDDGKSDREQSAAPGSEVASDPPPQ